MPEVIDNLLANLVFIFERLTWLGVLDIVLVAAVFFWVFKLLRGTQATMLLRGAFLIIALLALMSTFQALPAFSWLVRTTLPAMLLAIPVIFAPEIRHALERLGRAGLFRFSDRGSQQMEGVIGAIVRAVVRLSELQHGALIVLQRRDSLAEYVETGVRLDARLTTELIQQIFHPNTPLHDGAVVISGAQLVAAACVMPLSASGVLAEAQDPKMGLRHRAGLGISEATDAIALIVSEETGFISIMHEGKMLRRLDAIRVEEILWTFFGPADQKGFWTRRRTLPLGQVSTHLKEGK